MYTYKLQCIFTYGLVPSPYACTDLSNVLHNGCIHVATGQ